MANDVKTNDERFDSVRAAYIFLYFAFVSLKAYGFKRVVNILMPA